MAFFTSLVRPPHSTASCSVPSSRMRARAEASPLSRFRERSMAVSFSSATVSSRFFRAASSRSACRLSAAAVRSAASSSPSSSSPSPSAATQPPHWPDAGGAGGGDGWGSSISIGSGISEGTGGASGTPPASPCSPSPAPLSPSSETRIARVASPMLVKTSPSASPPPAPGSPAPGSPRRATTASTALAASPLLRSASALALQTHQTKKGMRNSRNARRSLARALVRS